MDNRIFELAKQAGFVNKGNNITAYLNFDHEKFAELIIQECARKLENDGMVEVAMELKWHFGIES